MGKDAAERIMGTEVEHGVNQDITNYGAAILKAAGTQYCASCRNSVIIHVSPTQHQMHVMAGPTIEIGSPECHGPVETALYEIAGMRLLLSAVTRANTDERPETPIHFYRNNCSLVNGNSWGHHACFQMAFDAFPRLIDHLPSLKAAWWGFVGNGWISEQRTRPEYFSFSFSQRAGQMFTKAAAETQHNRPVINTRDEPLIAGEDDRRTFRRFHDICGNTVMSDTQLVLMLGMTDLAVAVIEDGDFLAKRGLFFAAMADRAEGGLINALRRWNQDLEIKDRIPMIIAGPDGTSRTEPMTWLDVMRWWYETAAEFLKARPERSTPGRRETLRLWRFFLEAHERRDYELLAKYLDCWTVHREVYLPLLERRGINPDAPEIGRMVSVGGKEIRLTDHVACAIREFSNISPGWGLYWKILKKGGAARYFSEERILAAEQVPPRGRASMREEFCQRILREFPGWSPRIKNWSELGVENEEEGRDPHLQILLDSDGPKDPGSVEKFFRGLQDLVRKT